MPAVVYLLCAVTSVACALLLFRGYRASRTALLFWASLSFSGLALNNVLLVVDLLIAPSIDLSILRTSIAFVAVQILVLGLVWRSK